MSEQRWAPGRDPKHTFEAIDKANFEWILQHYRSSITPGEESEHLDKMRYKTIPDAIKARSQDAHLDKEELVTLVTWKLKHGVFRPALKTMAQQNNAEDVEATSRKGFEEFREGKPKDAIKTLAELRGIGPATASLMLSIYDPIKAPFFSDELFRWAFFESSRGNGWDRRIKYSAKEYAELYDKVQELIERLNVTAVDAEKVAYVLGKDDPIGAGARKELGKSSKRKAEELDHGVAALTAGQKTDAPIGIAGWHEAISEENRSRGVPDKLPPDEDQVEPTKEVAGDHATTDAGANSRPKRKNRKR